MHPNVCSYPYGGSVPLNLARLHASVAHYSSQDSSDYLVKVICVSDRMEAAQLVRTISEDTRKQNEVAIIVNLKFHRLRSNCNNFLSELCGLVPFLYNGDRKVTPLILWAGKRSLIFCACYCL